MGDTVQDLRRFVNKWDATLAGMATTPEEAVLRDILLRQIRPSQLLKYDIEVFDRASKKSHEKSYIFLHQSMKNLIDRERLGENRNRIAEKKTRQVVRKMPRRLPPEATVEQAGKPPRVVADPRNVVKGIKSATSFKRVSVIRGRHVNSNMCRMARHALSHPKETRLDHP